MGPFSETDVAFASCTVKTELAGCLELGWIAVGRAPQQQQVRANPELLGAFIEETLRYEPPAANKVTIMTWAVRVSSSPDAQAVASSPSRLSRGSAAARSNCSKM